MCVYVWERESWELLIVLPKCFCARRYKKENFLNLAYQSTSHCCKQNNHKNEGIKNIHIKLECELDSRNFSVGVCLESIESYTTNDNWEIHFTDRHQLESMDRCIYKLFNIKGLSVYWNSQSKKQQKNSLINELKESIYQQHDFLISPSKSLFS